MNTEKTRPDFTIEDFLNGKKFDYIVYSDRPDYGLNCYHNNHTLLLKKGNKIIGAILPFNDGTFQVNMWVLGAICVRYLRLSNCQHHKPVGLWIRSIKNRLNIKTNV